MRVYLLKTDYHYSAEQVMCHTKIKISIRQSLLLLLTLFFPKIYSQTCNCYEDLKFLTTSYTQNYSGIKDFINSHPRYTQAVDSLINVSINSSEINKCDSLISSFINYINNGHVVFGRTKENPLFRPQKKEKSNSPALKILNSKTVLISIPSADLSYKAELDSLIKLNKLLIDTAEHFIIDLRGNGGGGDAMFNELISYLYTNPIISYGVELWTSETNVKMFENLLSNPNIPTESKKRIEAILNKAKENPNKYVLLSDTKVDTLTKNTVLKYPKNISLLINKECKSATEQFLLLAKQSTKVTIYGYENSGGALDYSNLNVIILPSKYWYATVPTTRSTRLPKNPVDPTGIKPDIILNRQIKDPIKFIIRKNNNGI